VNEVDYAVTLINLVGNKNVERTQLDSLQTKIVYLLDKRCNQIMEYYTEHFDELSSEERNYFANYFFKILEIYHTLFNKLITNDDFLLMQIGICLNTTPERLKTGKIDENGEVQM
jgi:hypothetical protein